MRVVLIGGVLCLIALAGVLLLGALADVDEETFSVMIPSLDDPAATRLAMEESPPGRRWQYKLSVQSRVKRPVRLEVAFEAPAPEGMEVALAGEPMVPREATSNRTWLIFVAPDRVGPFGGRATLRSPDLPGWSRTYEFSGSVSERGLLGRYLRPRPRGVDFGRLRPGETRPFAVALESFGSEPVAIREIVPKDPDTLRLAADLAPATVPAGGEVPLRGLYEAPRRAGRHEATVEVFSDAENYTHALQVRVGCEVVPDYAPHPPSLEVRTEYPVMQRVYRVRILAREEVEPFVVSAVEHHERLFEVVSRGGDEPAREQTVELRVRRDAPTNVAEDVTFQVLFRLGPGGKEVAWPVRMRLYPPVYAYPHALQWGKDLAPQTIRLAAFDGRSLEVKRAYAERGLFEVYAQPARQGMTPEVLVSIPKGTGEGTLQDRVVIETGDPDVPRIIVPVQATVR